MLIISLKNSKVCTVFHCSVQCIWDVHRTLVYGIILLCRMTNYVLPACIILSMFSIFQIRKLIENWRIAIHGNNSHTERRMKKRFFAWWYKQTPGFCFKFCVCGDRDLHLKFIIKRNFSCLVIWANILTLFQNKVLSFGLYRRNCLSILLQGLSTMEQMYPGVQCGCTRFYDNSKDWMLWPYKPISFQIV